MKNYSLPDIDDSSPTYIFPEPGSPEEAALLDMLRTVRDTLESNNDLQQPVSCSIFSDTIGIGKERSSYFKPRGNGFYSLNEEIVSPSGERIGASNRAVARTILDALRYSTGKDINNVEDEIELASAELPVPGSNYLNEIESADGDSGTVIVYSVLYTGQNVADEKHPGSVYDNPQDVMFSNPRAVIEAMRRYRSDGDVVLKMAERDTRLFEGITSRLPEQDPHESRKLKHKRLLLLQLMEADLDSVATAQGQ